LIAVLEAKLRRTPRFLVLPWLTGHTLAAALAAGAEPDLPAALWIARQTAEALAALDAAGWMHGDVKPSNIFISPEGHVTLLDLGFARRRGEEWAGGDRCVLGTGRYLAPECLSGGPGGDIRSDIYSLGAVLFELLSGRVPFPAAGMAELAAQHRQAAPPNLTRLVPRLPAAVSALVRRMVAKDPLRRPQSPEELLRQLVALEIATFSERAEA
jgi:serine/threonine-protein kinase